MQPHNNGIEQKSSLYFMTPREVIFSFLSLVRLGLKTSFVGMRTRVKHSWSELPTKSLWSSLILPQVSTLMQGRMWGCGRRFGPWTPFPRSVTLYGMRAQTFSPFEWIYSVARSRLIHDAPCVDSMMRQRLISYGIACLLEMFGPWCVGSCKRVDRGF